MNGWHLPGNFVENPEALYRKTRTKLKKRSSTLQQEASSNQEDRRNLSSEFEAMASKTIREFSAPTADNIRTGPTAEIDGNFQLKPGLINMVQSNQFCGKAHEDASAHLQHFLEICSTFTISGVPRDAILLRLFSFSLLGRAKQWFYARILRGHSAPRTFWLSSFPWARQMLFVGRLQVSSNNMMNLF